MSDTQATAATPPTRGMMRRVLPHLFWIGLIAVVILAQWRVIANIGADLAGAEAEPDDIDWRTDWRAARAEAAASGKPILADFTADWCPPCQWMKRDTWPDDRVEAAVADATVPLLVDIDEPAGATLAQQYQVTGIPTILLLDAEGNVLRAGGFMDAEDMLAFIASAPRQAAPATP